MLAWSPSLLQTGVDAEGMPLPPASDVASTVFYALLIIVLATVVGIVAFAVRKRITQPEEPDAGAGMGFTLADLRAMHDAGEIDDAEFARCKAKMLAHARADLAEEDEDEDEEDGLVHLDGEPEEASESSPEEDDLDADDADDSDRPR
ncbi:MAG: SHOCT domain-containing protein [Planctomycetota bacterium]